MMNKQGCGNKTKSTMRRRKEDSMKRLRRSIGIMRDSSRARWMKKKGKKEER